MGMITKSPLESEIICAGISQNLFLAFTFFILNTIITIPEAICVMKDGAPKEMAASVNRRGGFIRTK